MKLCNTNNKQASLLNVITISKFERVNFNKIYFNSRCSRTIMKKLCEKTVKNDNEVLVNCFKTLIKL